MELTVRIGDILSKIRSVQFSYLVWQHQQDGKFDRSNLNLIVLMLNLYEKNMAESITNVFLHISFLLENTTILISCLKYLILIVKIKIFRTPTSPVDDDPLP